MIAVRAILSPVGRKMESVGFETLVIHIASFVGDSSGARTRSGPISPSSPGTAPGQTGSTSGFSAPPAEPGDGGKQTKQAKQKTSRGGYLFWLSGRLTEIGSFPRLRETVNELSFVNEFH